MPDLGPDQAQLAFRVGKQLAAELDALAKDYHLTKEGLCEALLLHAIEDDQIEVAVQKAKDLSDQRVRARRKQQRDDVQPANDESVVRLQRRGP